MEDERQPTLSNLSVAVLITLLLASTTINYIDRQVLSVLAPVLRDEFRLSNAQYAGILNAFMVTYAIAMPLAGWVADRVGVGRCLALSMIGWSVAGGLTSLARGAFSLGVFRSLLAVGESGAWPSFAKAVAIWVPPKWRTMAIGVCNSGSSIGSMVAPPLVVFIAHHYGWRRAFILRGALGLIWVIAFQVFRSLHPQMPAMDRGQTLGGGSAPKAKWKELVRYRQAWAIFVCRFFADPIWYFYIFWIPEFLARERGLNLTAIGAVAWIPFLVSAISNYATGLAALRLERRGWSVNRTRKLLMLAGAAVSPVGIAAVYAHSLFWTMSFVCVAIFFWMAWSVTVQTLATDYFPPHTVASVYAIGGTGSTVGSVISIWLVGRTLDLTHSYVPVFVGLGLLMPVAFLVGTRLMGRVEPVKLGATPSSEAVQLSKM
jgi:ACS family hexuronate transporter-like MFS transporter